MRRSSREDGMRAHRVVSSSLTFLCVCATLVLSQDDDTGYDAFEEQQDDIIAVDVLDGNYPCPSEALMRTRDICHFDGAEVPCIRLRCCEDYNHIAGRCIHKSVDPCSMKLCEQACQVIGDRVRCTCQPGYKFNVDNYKRKIQPFCVDIDECAVNNGGCEQLCVNDLGGHHCRCMPEFVLTETGKCIKPPVLTMASVVAEPLPLVRASSRCFAPCDTVTRLAKRVRMLSDQLQAVQSTMKKYIDAQKFSKNGDNYNEESSHNRVLNSIAPVADGYCRCERGPRGPPGPPGMDGPKGDTGPRGPRGAKGRSDTLDFMLLLVNELRHDIRNLENRVYNDGNVPERYNAEKAWQLHRKQATTEQERSSTQELEEYTPPTIQFTSDAVEITPYGLTGDITDGTTIPRLKDETEPFDSSPPSPSQVLEEKLRQLRLLAKQSGGGDDDEDDGSGDYDYGS